MCQSIFRPASIRARLCHRLQSCIGVHALTGNGDMDARALGRAINEASNKQAEAAELETEHMLGVRHVGLVRGGVFVGGRVDVSRRLRRGPRGRVSRGCRVRRIAGLGVGSGGEATPAEFGGMGIFTAGLRMLFCRGTFLVYGGKRAGTRLGNMHQHFSP